MTSDTPAADSIAFELLHLLRFAPTRLEAAPDAELGRAIEQRLRGETHACLRCGALAERAYLAPTQLYGNRWLDLCANCDDAMRRLLGTHPIEQGEGTPS